MASKSCRNNILLYIKSQLTFGSDTVVSQHHELCVKRFGPQSKHWLTLLIKKKNLSVLTRPTALRAVIKTKKGTILSYCIGNTSTAWTCQMFPTMIMHIAYSRKKRGFKKKMHFKKDRLSDSMITSCGTVWTGGRLAQGLSGPWWECLRGGTPFDYRPPDDSFVCDLIALIFIFLFHPFWISR